MNRKMLDEFKEYRRKAMESFYTYNFIRSNKKELSINENDRLVDKELLINKFKSFAEFKDLRDEDGWVDTCWIVSPEKEDEIKKNYEKYPIQTLYQKQEEVQNMILNHVTDQVVNKGISVVDSDAVSLLAELDDITYYETDNQSSVKMRLAIAALAKNPDELEKLSQKATDYCKNRGATIINYRLLGDPSFMIEKIATINESYNKFPEANKDFLKEFYFKGLSRDKQIRTISLYSFINRTENSDFAYEIINDQRFKDFSIMDNPKERRDFFYYDGMFHHIAQLLKNKTEVSDEFIERTVSPLVALIDYGILDSEIQKKQYSETLGNFRKYSKEVFHDKSASNKVFIKLEMARLNRQDYLDENMPDLLVSLVKSENVFSKFAPECISEFKETIHELNHNKKLAIINEIEKHPNNSFSKILAKELNLRELNVKPKLSKPRM